MKKTIFGATAVGIILFSAFKEKHIENYKADTTLSSMEWFAEKVGGKHNGIITLYGGTISNDHGNLSAVFEMDMVSIACKDMTGEYAAKMDKHLKSDDFFGVEKFPKAKFVSTSVAPIKDAKPGENTHTVKGNLTIKDKTNEITFDAVIKEEGGKIACVGTAIVDRSKYDIKYGSKTFFPEIGDKMINDEFKVKFSVVAVK
ncbi:MAG: YceI family protein [Bacteroidetes bacterium]|nr:MAG: YceI family protein [Bacteroidota bacterium]